MNVRHVVISAPRGPALTQQQLKKMARALARLRRPSRPVTIVVHHDHGRLPPPPLPAPAMRYDIPSSHRRLQGDEGVAVGPRPDEVHLPQVDLLLRRFVDGCADRRHAARCPVVGPGPRQHVAGLRGPAHCPVVFPPRWERSKPSNDCRRCARTGSGSMRRIASGWRGFISTTVYFTRIWPCKIVKDGKPLRLLPHMVVEMSQMKFTAHARDAKGVGSPGLKFYSKPSKPLIADVIRAASKEQLNEWIEAGRLRVGRVDSHGGVTSVEWDSGNGKKPRRIRLDTIQRLAAREATAPAGTDQAPGRGPGHDSGLARPRRHGRGRQSAGDFSGRRVRRP